MLPTSTARHFHFPFQHRHRPDLSSVDAAHQHLRFSPLIIQHRAFSVIRGRGLFYLKNDKLRTHLLGHQDPAPYSTTGLGPVYHGMPHLLLSDFLLDFFSASPTTALASPTPTASVLTNSTALASRDPDSFRRLFSCLDNRRRLSSPALTHLADILASLVFINPHLRILVRTRERGLSRNCNLELALLGHSRSGSPQRCFRSYRCPVIKLAWALSRSRQNTRYILSHLPTSAQPLRS